MRRCKGQSPPPVQEDALVEVLWLLLKGLALGVAIAAPVGPIGLLCIRRTLEQGPMIGYATCMGEA